MYIKMKKILIPLACLSALTLSACQTSTKPTGQASSSKTASTHKSSSKSKAAPKENSQAKKPKSAKQSSAVKNSSSSASSKASSSSSSPTSSSSSSSAASSSSSSSSNAPAGYQALFEGETLTSFVNKYGESPAAYLSEHYGLSPKEALYATPDSLETFGEMQSESMYRKGQDPFAN
ncbi:Hypothetical extracellular protein [Lactobacillus equicursoris DSM 19284 = JCM 14600 = CIP 110162]|uniref:Lipoprotein n=1 Tax=Lactobacillus equicursoris DSM 19284 = JCM 14600 = CIP 110162 TaxID=1293597 RepID=K0NSS2_9LACO|nr:hypothetical protein [Lactobacillus equicursoris]KRL01552.1 hypothetical protein FC20_GL000850 [Lactobacillus equicursoris DSM 19284 = JCM 14600 = CIP 110162]CCK85299.1 Hypothetical extracellular protein [Lactobacillus equicursoris DSM 19284 = JCM 14600 = CIP 110162]